MRMYDIILKKRNGGALTEDEIKYFISECVTGNIPDYQISALLMAIYFRGMNDTETSSLTINMANSGERADLSEISGIKVDKHSAGGVGDKTTLIIAPLAAACGVKVAKMSGRGLGHTGGTIDKLEAIPGFRTSVSKSEFIRNVNSIGVCIAGQTENLAPADKKLYALRDVTATVDNRSLIAASIMSKKLASGSDKILLDVKVGSGAFMKSYEDAKSLAECMIKIGKAAGKNTVAILSDMNAPLGNAVGNISEVYESIRVLEGRGPHDLTEICIELAANMIYLAEIADSIESARDMAKKTLRSGAALEKFYELVKCQGGQLDDMGSWEKPKYSQYKAELLASESGYISSLLAQECGYAACILGAGRENKEDTIDYGASIILHAKPGDKVNRGDVLAELYSSDKIKLQSGLQRLEGAYSYSETAPVLKPLILGRLS